jgi:anti-sigma regulatory factor (Ser/Thr protein kinase)
MNDSQTTTFPGQFDSLAAIGEFITQAAEAAGLDDRAVYAVQLAVDEACSNIIEHAYGGEEEGDIEITYHINGNGLTVILRDQGCVFDPSDVSEPDRQCDLEERSVGGLGIFFMRQLMDEVHFECTLDSGNKLTMIKYKEPIS